MASRPAGQKMPEEIVNIEVRSESDLDDAIERFTTFMREDFEQAQEDEE